MIVQMSCVFVCLYRYIVRQCSLCMPFSVGQLINPLVTMCLTYVVTFRQSVYTTCHLCLSLLTVSATRTL